MPFLPVPGAQLYYETAGSGPALVFAHGLAGNHLSWWQQVPRFRDRYTCVTFAHRGFWPSTEEPGGPGPGAFVDDLAALVDHLGLDDVRLVAQSMGGWTCLGYALRAPERVRALVMASTTGSLIHPDLDRLYRERGSDPRSELLERGMHPAAGERMAREQPALYFLYEELSTLSGLGATLDRDAMIRALISLRTTPPEAVAALPMPVLCILGEEDIVMLPAAIQLFASLAPGARLARVREAGHSVYFERAETFNRILEEFLTEVDGAQFKTEG